MDAKYMKLAIELAKKGTGKTDPNPLVGAVIVKDGQIIGQGFHERYGQLHAERNALKNCTKDPKGATIYVTLEPCCHHGKTPPCTDAILESGIKRVVVGSMDPNTLVGGKGIEILKNAGLDVELGVLEEECLQLNQVFFHYIKTKKPYIAMKYAMTLDGKIATFTGDSKWITEEPARNHVQSLRNKYTAIMVGSNTILADNPRLTCRMEGGRNPIRIICDTRLRTPLDAYVVETAKSIPTIIATACTQKDLLSEYEEKGVKCLILPTKDGHIDLNALMSELGQMSINSILLEGGASLNWSFVNEGLVNKVYTYIAPKLLGGIEAKTPISGTGFALAKEALVLSTPKIHTFGQDVLLESEVLKCSQE